MRMFDVWQMNYAIELWGVAFCVVGILCALLLVRADRSYCNLLVAMFSLEALAAVGDACTMLYAGITTRFARMMTGVGNFAVFACTFLLQAAITLYLCLRFAETSGPTYRGWRLGVCMAAVVMCLLTGLGAFYGFDAANLYFRKDGYWLSLVFVGATSVVNATLVIKNRGRLGRTALACLLFYTISPVLAAILQAFVFGPNLAIAAGVVALVVVFLELQLHSANMLLERTEELARARDEAAEARVAAMVSQIQPHFLFNTLDTIYGLAGEDGELARTAIADFSSYLRTNLDSLRRTEPVPIETELEHVRTYLDLERMSDDDRISYEMDVVATNFKVPLLSVQVLAENAVKHGLAATERGGTVTIRTRELPQEYTVTVIDDGVGFAMRDIADGSGVGIENTRSRLAAMCGGTLELTSMPGAGTSAIIRIPK